MSDSAKTLLRLGSDEVAQDLFEYALLIALIALAVVVTVTLLGGSLAAFYQSVADVWPGSGG